jgi:AraC-like DNA-binding protein
MPKPLTTAERLDRAQAYVVKAGIRANFTDAARVAGMSRFHFHKAFRERFGYTVKSAATMCQIELAQKLLREGKKDLAAIAETCGFSHISHFVSVFRRIVGKTPGKWRKATVAMRKWLDDRTKEIDDFAAKVKGHG